MPIDAATRKEEAFPLGFELGRFLHTRVITSHTWIKPTPQWPTPRTARGRFANPGLRRRRCFEQIHTVAMWSIFARSARTE
jgi:hypothetical protein